MKKSSCIANHVAVLKRTTEIKKTITNSSGFSDKKKRPPPEKMRKCNGSVLGKDSATFNQNCCCIISTARGKGMWDKVVLVGS